MARQGRFLCRRQLAWPVAAPRTGADFTGATPPDQRLVDVRHADPEHRGRCPRRHAAVNRHQNPRPQVLRIALTLPPSHRRPQHLVVRAANHTFPRAGIPSSDSGQCGYALATVPLAVCCRYQWIRVQVSLAAEEAATLLDRHLTAKGVSAKAAGYMSGGRGAPGRFRRAGRRRVRRCRPGAGQRPLRHRARASRQALRRCAHRAAAPV